MIRDKTVGMKDIHKLVKDGWVVCEVYPPNRAFAIFFDRDIADEFCEQIEEREEEHMHVVTLTNYLIASQTSQNRQGDTKND